MENQEFEETIKNQRKQSRKGFWAGVLTGALVTAFAGLLLVGMSAGIYLFSREIMKNQTEMTGPGAAPAITSQEGKKTLNYQLLTSKISLIQQIIGRHFLYEEDIQEVEDYIYKGMLAGLQDPYSVYYTSEEFKSVQDSTLGTYSGIGAMISQNRQTGLCTVVRVFEGFPAYEAGIQPGDVIYKVEDELVAGESLDVLINNYIKGKEGTKVRLTVYRAEQDQYEEMELTRRQIEYPTVEFRMLDDQYGYVSVLEFDQVTVNQFERAIQSLTDQGMKGMIIDLRNNPGGMLDSAVKMADYILPDNLDQFEKGGGKTVIVYTEDKNQKGDVYTAEDGHQLDLPIVILQNEDSASASEVFAGALKDYDRAAIVGTSSYGKGIVQNLIPLGDGSVIKITVAHYYTPSGFDLHGKGIAPNVEEELKEELRTQAVIAPEEDNQLLRAIEVLKTRE